MLGVGWLKEWSTTPKPKSRSRQPVVASGQNEDLECAGKKGCGQGWWQGATEHQPYLAKRTFKFFRSKQPATAAFLAVPMARILNSVHTRYSIQGTVMAGRSNLPTKSKIKYTGLTHYVIFLDITHGGRAVPQVASGVCHRLLSSIFKHGQGNRSKKAYL